MSKAALVIMAAGMASRYGGNKQIEGMGPNGEILMEYSICDAIRAGFTKVIFIIKPEMLDKMKEICGDRLSKQIEVCYAFQDFSSIPPVYTVPAGRVKPFGTVHAVLCAEPYIDEPFAVINADDYYGVESFAQMYAFLTGMSGNDQAAMMGYHLSNTVSRYGAVTRGICHVDGGRLVDVREVRQIRQMEDGQIVNLADGEILDPAASVSMNFWGFSKEIFGNMRKAFEVFLTKIPEGDLTAEYLLPVLIDQMIHADALHVRVLPTQAIWFGVTYKEDRPTVAEALKRLHEGGLYTGSARSQSLPLN